MQGCNLQESEMDLKARFAAPLPNVQICHSWMRTGLFLDRLCQLSSVPALLCASAPWPAETLFITSKHLRSPASDSACVQLQDSVRLMKERCQILWWRFAECNAQLLHCILHVQYWYYNMTYEVNLWQKKLNKTKKTIMR